jgi:hypothetical protein
MASWLQLRLTGEDADMNTRMTGSVRGFRAGLAITLLGALPACIETDAGDGPVGAVEVAVTIDAVDVPALDYEVSGIGMASMKGRVATARPGAAASVALNQVPAGRFAAISLTGKSGDGATSCQGSALLDVTPAQRSQVRMVLLCRTSNAKSPVPVRDNLRSCPVIESYSVSTRAAVVGSPITVQASASDADAGDVLRFSWSAPVGTFSSAKQPYTRYECAEPGDRVLTVSVTDGWCTYINGFAVSCKPTTEGKAPALSRR